MIGGLLLSAWATEMIGIHAIFGAFLFGVAMPRDRRVKAEITKGRGRHARVPPPDLLRGRRPVDRFGLLDQRRALGVAVAVIAGRGRRKVGADDIRRTILGERWRQSAALGLLMNTRGLTEIVILTVGRSLGVISPALFTIMVLMALVTTMMATPLLARVYPQPLIKNEAAKQARLDARPIGDLSGPLKVVVAVDTVSRAAALAGFTSALRDAAGHKPEIVLAHIAPLPRQSELSVDLYAADDSVEVARIQYAALAGRLLGDGFDTTIRVRLGEDPCTELLRLVAEEDPDLLVLGWPGSLRAEGAMFGVLAAAIEQAECDVAVLADGGRGWTDPTGTSSRCRTANGTTQQVWILRRGSPHAEPLAVPCAERRTGSDRR